MIRVLLADDQTSVRRGLRMRLDLESGIAVIGEAGDGESAVELARELAADVVLMDVEMPGLDGIEATQRLRQEAPACAVVILTIHDDARTRARAREAGAAAFVSKHQMDGQLMAAILSASANAGGAD